MKIYCVRADSCFALIVIDGNSFFTLLYELPTRSAEDGLSCLRRGQSFERFRLRISLPVTGVPNPLNVRVVFIRGKYHRWKNQRTMVMNDAKFFCRRTWFSHGHRKARTSSTTNLSERNDRIVVAWMGCNQIASQYFFLPLLHFSPTRHFKMERHESF